MCYRRCKYIALACLLGAATMMMLTQLSQTKLFAECELVCERVPTDSMPPAESHVTAALAALALTAAPASTPTTAPLPEWLESLPVMKRYRSRGIAAACHNMSSQRFEQVDAGAILQFARWGGWGNIVTLYAFVEALGDVLQMPVRHIAVKGGNLSPNDFFHAASPFLFTRIGDSPVGDLGVRTLHNLTDYLKGPSFEHGIHLWHDKPPTPWTWVPLHLVRSQQAELARFQRFGAPEQIPKKEDVVVFGQGEEVWRSIVDFEKRHRKELNMSCIYRRIFHRPHAFVVKAMQPVLERIGPNDLLIGLHVRMGDHYMLDETLNLSSRKNVTAVNREYRTYYDKRTSYPALKETFNLVDQIIERKRCCGPSIRDRRIKIFIASDTKTFTAALGRSAARARLRGSPRRWICRCKLLKCAGDIHECGR
eukprot:TRINITY_DN9471_c0_g1_i3.p1 TRINITY_DN9471_c0_g1~~TRINITY_DN9471_c0_g1_i3.p1  ORF type:complete len:423 (+),score=17.37 TRINITY_DN9471_c0_g1_i3:99-1367(+)